MLEKLAFMTHMPIPVGLLVDKPTYSLSPVAENVMRFVDAERHPVEIVFDSLLAPGEVYFALQKLTELERIDWIEMVETSFIVQDTRLALSTESSEAFPQVSLDVLNENFHELQILSNPEILISEKVLIEPCELSHSQMNLIDAMYSCLELCPMKLLGGL